MNEVNNSNALHRSAPLAKQRGAIHYREGGALMRHRCFGRSISRKLAAAVMAVSLLAGGYRKCGFCQEQRCICY